MIAKEIFSHLVQQAILCAVLDRRRINHLRAGVEDRFYMVILDARLHLLACIWTAEKVTLP